RNSPRSRRCCSRPSSGGRETPPEPRVQPQRAAPSGPLAPTDEQDLSGVFGDVETGRALLRFAVLDADGEFVPCEPVDAEHVGLILRDRFDLVPVRTLTGLAVICFGVAVGSRVSSSVTSSHLSSFPTSRMTTRFEAITNVTEMPSSLGL